MGVTGFLDRARQVHVGSNRTRLHSRLRVRPGFPGRGSVESEYSKQGFLEPNSCPELEVFILKM